jgi:4-amino-4-deoxy-L-arabinose transferase-like glycosyltransferase
VRWWPLLPVAALAAALRWFRIDAQSLWYDEGISAHQLTRSFLEIVRAAAQDTHPPLYYWTLKAWGETIGSSELGLRSLSAVGGLLAVVLTFFIGRRLFGTLAGTLAALLLATAPLAVYYSQEVRMYAQVTAVGLLAVYAYVLRKNWLYVVAGIATLYTQYLGAALLIAINLHAVIFWRSRSRREWGVWLGANVIVALAFLPWLPTFIDQQSHSLNTSPRTVQGLFVDTLTAYGGGIAHGDPYLAYGAALVVLALLGAAIIFVQRTTPPLQRTIPPQGSGGTAEPGAARQPAASNPQRGAQDPALAAERIVPEPAPNAERGTLPEPVLNAERGTLPEPVLNAERGTLPEPVLNAERGTLPEPVLNVERGTLPEPGLNAERGTLPEPGLNAERGTLPELVLNAEGGTLPAPAPSPQHDSPLPRRSPSARRGAQVPSAERGTLLLLVWLMPLALVIGLGLRSGLYEVRYLVVSLPGLALLAGVALSRLGRFPVVAVALGFLAVVPAASGLWQQYFDPALARDDYRDLVADIERGARPTDAVILSAPNQSEVFNYYYHGSLATIGLPAQRPIDPEDTLRRLAAIRAQYDRVWLVSWAMNEADPRGVTATWLAQNGFQATHEWYGGVQLALIGFGPANAAAQSVGATLDNGIVLEDYRLASRSLKPGETLALTLDWRADQAPIADRWKVFTHLLDSGSQVVAQRDAEPADNLRPTTTWQPGERIEDNYGIVVPADLPAGSYTLEIGMYDGETRARFNGEGDHMVLGEIQVQP